MPCLAGLPYTTPNKWTFQQEAAGEEVIPGLVVEVASLNVMVDVYNTHHRCCWPRTYVDSVLSKTHEESLHLLSNNRSVYDRVGPPLAALEPVRTLATTISDVYQNQCMDMTREARCFRVDYQHQLPPVLRQSHDGGIVYVVHGSIHILSHGSNDSAGAELPSREVFPMMLAVQPAESCAAYMRPDPPEGRGHDARSGSQLLLLQAVERVAASCEGDPSTSFRLRATYSPFTWILSPGMEWQDVGRMKRGNVRRVMKRGACTPSSFSVPPGILLGFDVFASYFASREARCATLAQVAALTECLHYNSKAMKFGIAPDVYMRAERVRIWRRQCRALQERPRQFIENLDGIVGAKKRGRVVAEMQNDSSTTISGCVDEKEEADHGMDARSASHRWRANPRSRATLRCIGRLWADAPIPIEACHLSNALHCGAIFPQSTVWPICIKRPFVLMDEAEDDSVDILREHEPIRIDRTNTLGDVATALNKLLQMSDAERAM